MEQSLKSLRQEVIDLISEMSDEQCAVALEAFKIGEADSTKSPDECVVLAAKRLGIPLKNVRKG